MQGNRRAQAELHIDTIAFRHLINSMTHMFAAVIRPLHIITIGDKKVFTAIAGIVAAPGGAGVNFDLRHDRRAFVPLECSGHIATAVRGTTTASINPTAQ